MRARHGIVAGIFSRALLQISAGVLVGSGLAALAGGLGSTREVLLLLAADGIMLVVGLAACALPLRRALTINPTEALRAEGMMRRGLATGALCLSLALGGSGCEPAAYDVDGGRELRLGASATTARSTSTSRASDGGRVRAARPSWRSTAARGGAATRRGGSSSPRSSARAATSSSPINYRRSGRPDGTWPAQIEDVQKALRYVRANARRFGVDPARIASLGMSAGGHLATMVALRDDPAGPDGRVRVAVNLDGEHDMTMPPDR